MNQDNSPGDLKNSVQVTGSLEITKMEKINFSESDLLAIYNNVPQVLTKKAVQVSITEDSLNSTNNVPIILETLKKGSYWIIAIEESIYLLLPKSNLIINPHSYHTVKLLFNCHGYQADDTREFTVNKPAKVSPMPNPQQWKLEEMGVLDFSDISLLSQLKLELQQTNQDRQQLQFQLEEVTQYREQFQYKLEQIQGERSLLISQLQQSNREIQQLHTELEQLHSQLEQSSVEKSHLTSQLQQSNRELEQLQTELAQSQENYAQLQSELSQAQLQLKLSQTQEAVQEIEKLQFQKERAKMSLVKDIWVRSQSQIEQLKQDREEFQSELDQLQEDNNQLQNQLEESQEKLATLQSQPDKEVSRESQSQQVNPKLHPNSEEAKVVKFYMNNSDLLLEYAIEVSETE